MSILRPILRPLVLCLALLWPPRPPWRSPLDAARPGTRADPGRSRPGDRAAARRRQAGRIPPHPGSAWPPPAAASHASPGGAEPPRSAADRRSAPAGGRPRRRGRRGDAAHPGPPPPPAAAAPAAGAGPTPAKPEADPLIAPNTVGAQLLAGLSGRVAGLSDSLVVSIRSMADLPALWAATANLLRDPVSQTRLTDAAWKLLLLLGLGLLAEWAVVRAVGRPRRWLDAAAPPPNGTPWTWLRRVPLVLGRLLLDLLPILGFGLAVYGFFGLLQPLPTTRLVGLMMANAYMAARTAFALARMLLSPASNHLRLIPSGCLRPGRHPLAAPADAGRRRRLYPGRGRVAARPALVGL